MNKENIQKRLNEIEGAIVKQNQLIQQAIANLNLLEGSKHECMHWLKTFDENETALNSNAEA